MQPTRAHGAHPQAAGREGKHISQIWSAACLGESHLVRRAGHPAHPPLVTLEYSSLLGPPSPCPSDHRKCQQSESQENPLQPTQTGWGCRRGTCPFEASEHFTQRLREGWQRGPNCSSTGHPGEQEDSAECKVYWVWSGARVLSPDPGELLGPPRAASVSHDVSSGYELRELTSSKAVDGL